MMRKGMVAAIAGWSALISMGAHAQTRVPPCLTPDEAEATVQMMLPGLLRGFREACRPKLSTQAYVLSRSAELDKRFSDAADTVGPAADRAIAKIAGLPRGIAIPNVAKLFDPMAELLVAGEAGKLDAKTCGQADRMLELIDPLPARNLAALVGIVLELAIDSEKPGKDGKGPPFTICKPVRT